MFWVFDRLSKFDILIVNRLSWSSWSDVWSVRHLVCWSDSSYLLDIINLNVFDCFVDIDVLIVSAALGWILKS